MSVELEALNLTIKDLELTVKKHHLEKGGGKFQVIDYEIKSLGNEVPGGLLSSNFIITVKIREKRVTYTDLKDCYGDSSSESSTDELSCSFFIKCFPHDDFGVKYAQDLAIYRKERKLYEQLIPRLQDVGLGHEPWSPRCYHTKEDTVIILQDLQAEHFIPSRSTVLDFEHLAVALKTLARLHAASIAVEERTRCGELPKLYPHALDENAYPDNGSNGYRQTGVRVMTKTILELVKLVPGYDDWDINEILEAFPEVINRIYELVKPSDKYRNVFNQADLWASNILFKYDDEIKRNHHDKESDDEVKELKVAKHPVDCRLIDFQFSRYAPPAFEIATLLTASNTRDFREKHIRALLNIYYTALDSELSLYGFVTEDLIRREDFYQSYQDYRLAGLIESLLFNQIIFLPIDFWTELTLSSEKFEDFLLNRHTEICLEAFEKDEFYRTKITELLQETIDLYVLKSEFDARL